MDHVTLGLGVGYIWLDRGLCFIYIHIFLLLILLLLYYYLFLGNVLRISRNFKRENYFLHIFNPDGKMRLCISRIQYSWFE